MPGVIRPYTLTDVLSTITGQAGQAGSATIGANSTTFGIVAEADESIPAGSMADTAATIPAVPAPWDRAIWGMTSWQ